MITSPSTDNTLDRYEEPRIHMETFLAEHLVNFDFPMRILCPLDRAGIKTIGDLSRQTSKSLRKVKNLGKLSVERIEEFLHRWGLQLAQ